MRSESRNNDKIIAVWGLKDTTGRKYQLDRRNLEKWERFDLVKENKEYEAKLAEKNLHKATGGDRKSKEFRDKQQRETPESKNQGRQIFAQVEESPLDTEGKNQPPQIFGEVEIQPKQTKKNTDPVPRTKKPDKHAGETSAKQAEA